MVLILSCSASAKYAMTADIFSLLTEQLAAEGPAAALARLVEYLRAEKRPHELFDALLMQARERLGLPIASTGSLDELAELLRAQVEEAYFAACREVGALLLDEGRLRECWVYLRPLGDKRLAAAGLERISVTGENVADFVEIALYEGMAPGRGLQAVVDHYGLCNAITTFESALAGRAKEDQREGAAVLLRHVCRELTANVRADIEQREGKTPGEETLLGLVRERPDLFADHNYHLDTTHLAATVRFARVLEEEELLRLALDLCEYGMRLSSQYQYRGEEPFGELFAAHRWFFTAVLGTEGTVEALAYFRAKAESLDPLEHGVAPAETYVAILARRGEFEAAIEAALRLIPAGTRTSGVAPTLLDLSQRAGNYARLLQTCRSRQDLIGYAAALLAARDVGAAAP